MPFQHACFVSYRHLDQRTIDEEIDPFVHALEGELGNWIDVDQRLFVDRDRMGAGTFIQPALSNALCRSACMIVLYTPVYFSLKHTYCAREYRAMEVLEEVRLARLPDQKKDEGLIIPVILRGKEHFPLVIRDRRLAYAFSFDRLFLLPTASRKLQLKAHVLKIAERIYQRWTLLAPFADEFTSNCQRFAFPTEHEVRSWLENLVTPTSAFPVQRGV
jgi:hypothetical protein